MKYIIPAKFYLFIFVTLTSVQHMLCLITYKVRSENGYGFLRPGLKMGMGNGIFWSEIGSRFGDSGGTPPPKIPRSIPPGPASQMHRTMGSMGYQDLRDCTKKILFLDPNEDNRYQKLF